MIVYLDMDGVIADFFGGLEKHCEVLHWKEISNIEKVLDTLKDTNFFYHLDPFYEEKFVDGTGIVCRSYELIKFVKNLTGTNWGICSTPLRGDRDNSSYWKRRWLENYGYDPLPQNIIFTSHKHKFAVSSVDGTPNILVDDKQSNIDKWNAAGGIGIRYQSNQDDLNEYLFPLLKEYYS